ncbi:AAA family ATPase [Aquisphaera insulae]|uniref:AAA family ATPase n=1 Tax=Aquisphaera insulae TaxID=2712864 RepID=UPI0013EC1D4A|nr:ATP-binding protein [Aquisphaera insulae]
MIIELTIENFKSFLEAMTIGFAAGTTSQLPGNLLRHRNGERFVKSMALYGLNACGKTTVLDALHALSSFVLFSSQDQKPTAKIPHFEPFALDRSSSLKPARVALVVDLEGDRYTLDVSATADRVWSETLRTQRVSKQPSRKATEKILIERRWDPDKRMYITSLHEDLGTDLTRRSVLEQTPRNRLMLGKLSSMGHAVASRIMQWFDEDLQFYDMHRNPYSEDAMLTTTARLLRENPAFAEMVERLMRDADTGIRRLRVVDEKVAEPVILESGSKLEWKEGVRPGLSFQHAARDGSETIFRRRQESSGTLRFVALIAAILHPSPRRRLICIDELSASMHPALVRRLLRVVHGRTFNNAGNQILFTTHDTHLMNRLLRRDQIMICKKSRFGRSAARRLDEYQDTARSDANLEKQYLDGRFGGVPQFGPTLEDVPVDAEPLELDPR